MSEIELQFTFNIDAGELDGIDPKTVFTLGYELGRVSEICKRVIAFRGKAFALLHNEDHHKNRVSEAARFYGVLTEWSVISDDWAEVTFVPMPEGSE